MCTTIGNSDITYVSAGVPCRLAPDRSISLITTPTNSDRAPTPTPIERPMLSRLRTGKRLRHYGVNTSMLTRPLLAYKSHPSPTLTLEISRAASPPPAIAIIASLPALHLINSLGLHWS